MQQMKPVLLMAALAIMIVGCGKQFDFTLTPTEVTSAAQSSHVTVTACLNTLGTGHLNDSLPPGQIVAGSVSGVGSGCLFGQETATEFDRGAVIFDLSMIPPEASFATIDLKFKHVGGSEFSTSPSCVMNVDLATVDWTKFSNTASPNQFVGITLSPITWTINSDPLNVGPAGPNVNFGALTYTVDLKPAFNHWFAPNNNKKSNFGLIFVGNNEPFPAGTAAACYEVLGNFSLHVAGSS